MKSSDVNRRNFIKASAMSIVAGAAASAEATSAVDPAEVSEWKSLEGSHVRLGDAEMLLKSVDVTDWSADPARPRHIRSYSISLLFVCEGSQLNLNDREIVRHRNGASELALTRIVPPTGATGMYFEAVLN